MKKLLSLVLGITLLLTATVIVPVHAATSGTCGAGLTWTLDTSNGVLTISGQGEMTNYYYTENDSGEESTAPWGSNWRYIRSVVICDGVTSIGTYAFGYCDLLTEISIPDSVTKIGYGAFYSCNKLESVTLPRGMTKIGDELFQYCSLKSVVIPDTVTEIGASAFESCKLTNIDIPNSVKKIGMRAFSHCSSLTDVTLGNSVESIGGGAFEYCYNLESIELPDSVKEIGWSAFSNCRKLTSINLPDGLETIEAQTFYFCQNLTSVTIPDSVTTIAEFAFYSCRITDISMGNGITSIGGEAFSGCPMTSVDFGRALRTINNNAFNGCKYLKEVTFRSVPYICTNAFAGCAALTDVYVEGTKDDWNDIRMNAEDGNNPLKQATVHYIDSNPCALGHDYIATVVPATASDKGYTLHTCSRCGDFYKDQFTPVISDTDAVIKVVAPGRVLAGSVFTVDVKAENNPGINAFSIAINYDHNSFTLNGAEVNHDIGGRFVFTQKAVWVSAGDYTGDGVLFTLSFTALEDIELGDKYISLNWEPTDITNFLEDEVAFNMTPAVISAADSDHIPGDINGDGAVNTKDLTRLIRVLAGDDISRVEEALDVNGDGEINIKDLVRLMKYLSGDNVVIY